MDDRMSPAEVAATRRLIGLTAEQMGEELGINPRTIRSWEAGKYTPGQSATGAIFALRAEHDAETARLADGAVDGMIVSIPDGPRAPGWYLALAARVIDRVPDAMIERE